MDEFESSSRNGSGWSGDRDGGVGGGVSGGGLAAGMAIVAAGR